MSLRLVTAIARERARQPFAFALLLLLAVIRIVPASAQDSDDAYSGTVKVDATADSAAAARDLARIDGQRQDCEYLGALESATELFLGRPFREYQHGGTGGRSVYGLQRCAQVRDLARIDDQHLGASGARQTIEGSLE